MINRKMSLKNDTRFVDIYNDVKGKDRVSMCTVLDEIEEKGIEKGIEKGRDTTLISLVQDGLLDISIAAERANMSIDDFMMLMEKV